MLDLPPLVRRYQRVGSELVGLCFVACVYGALDFAALRASV